LPSHQFLEHTGETRLLVRGGSLAEVFEEAARALGQLERESLQPTGEAAAGRVQLESPDLPALLVDWLNELIYWCEAERAVPDQVAVRLGDGALPSSRPADQPPCRPADSPPCRLDAQVHGRRLSHRPALVKAATHHGLRLEQTAHGWEAEVVLDV
jgi:SHS2 domain-containing protein